MYQRYIVTLHAVNEIRVRPASAASAATPLGMANVSAVIYTFNIERMFEITGEAQCRRSLMRQ
jgi:hypothetical protein